MLASIPYNLMKRNYYLFSNGRLARKDNTIFVIKQEENKEESKVDPLTPPECEETEEQITPSKKEEKIPLPVEDIESIYMFGEFDLNTKVLNFLSQRQITLHVFNYYGYYSGSYYPREYLNSGKLLVRQVEHYQSDEKRMELAREFVLATSDNTLKNLQYYNRREKDLSSPIESIKGFQESAREAKSVSELMGLEGNIKQAYYKSWNIIVDQEIDFKKRVKQPPDNMINTLISFLNTMVYTTCLGELYRTQLNPLISYLHEPGTSRFSLSLDLAEIFKPIFADRIIFSLLNKNQLKEKDFDKQLNFCYMKEKARKIVVKEYDDKLKTTIKHRTLERQVSYRRLVRLECYKLIKHLLGESQYEGLRMWW